jgi:hypothetical protein
LPAITWIRFRHLAGGGLVFYFLYGYKHSAAERVGRLSKSARFESEIVWRSSSAVVNDSDPFVPDPLIVSPSFPLSTFHGQFGSTNLADAVDHHLDGSSACYSGGSRPASPSTLKPLSTIFLNMIKSLIAPLLFATLVVGIAGTATT